MSDNYCPHCIAMARMLVAVGMLLPMASPEVCRADEGTPPRERGLVTATTRKKFTFPTQREHARRIDQMLRQREKLIAKLAPPILLCPRVPDGSIRVDGNLNDEAWRQAALATRFKATRDLKPSQLATKAYMAWDSKFLYVGFDADDTDVIATINKPDGDFWKEDTVEVFIDPDGDGMSYLEFEVSPRKLLYDGSVADYRPEVDWVGDLEHLDIEGSAARYRVRDSQVAVQVRGTLNNSRDRDRGWTTEFAIAWSDIERGTNTRALPPASGDSMRVGLYHINNRQAGDEKFAAYDAWSPTTTWFHEPHLFGHVIFVENSPPGSP